VASCTGFLFQQVEQAVFGKKGFAVEIDFQPGIQVGVVPEFLLHKLRQPAEIAEQAIVGLEKNQGAVFFLGWL
jgi:hypothetical protein